MSGKYIFMIKDALVNLTISVRYFGESLSGTDIALITTIFLAVFGWTITAWLQQRNVKDQQRAKISYDIYSQLVTAHKELQDTIGALSASTQAPLTLMRSKLIPLKIRHEIGDRVLTPVVTEVDCLHNSEVTYSDWIYQDLLPRNSLYLDKLSAFLYLTEDWAAPLASTEHALSVLRTEVGRLNSVIFEHMNSLQFYTLDHGHDWRKWNEDDVYGHGRAISDSVMLVGNYVSDFMVIAHNDLLAPYYGYQRKVRKTYDDSYRVLTKEGLVTRIENDPEIRARMEELIRQNAPDDENNR